MRYTLLVNENLEGSKKNLLILGITSSLAPSIVSSAKLRGYTIYGTCRSLKDTSPDLKVSVNLIELDISSKDSISKFENYIRTIKLNFIVSLIGQTSRKINTSQDYDYIALYFSSYITNLIYLFDTIIPHYLDDNQELLFAYVSSRAALYGSFDPYYAATKSAIQSYIASVSRKYLNITFFVILSGLIEGSKMMREMDVMSLMSHRTRANNQLAHVDDFGEFLFSITQSENLNLINWFGENY